MRIILFSIVTVFFLGACFLHVSGAIGKAELDTALAAYFISGFFIFIMPKNNTHEKR